MTDEQRARQARIDAMWEECNILWKQYKKRLNECDGIQTEAREIYAERDKLMIEQRDSFV